MGVNNEQAIECCITLRRDMMCVIPVFSMESPHSLTGNHDRDLSSCIRLSFDRKDIWKNGIYENSRYATFMVDFVARKVKLLSAGVGTKFRQTSFKDATDLILKLRGFIRSTYDNDAS
jgi:hypothetical protein